MVCFVEDHKSHNCSDINKVEDDFRKQMTCDIDSVAAGVDKCGEMLESLEKEKNEFVEQVEKTGVEISEKAEQLKQMIDILKEKLMNELSVIRQKRMKEIESLHEEIERQLLSMESYKKYVDEVRQKGTACDIARAASGLHYRADELLKFDVIERTLADLGHADVKFASSDFLFDDVKKTLGHLMLKSTGYVKKALGDPVQQSTGYITTFTARRNASVVCAMALCLSQAGIVKKLPKAVSQKRHLTRAYRLTLTPKILMQFKRGHLKPGAPNTGGLKLAIFNQCLNVQGYSYYRILMATLCSVEWCCSE